MSEIEQEQEAPAEELAPDEEEAAAEEEEAAEPEPEAEPEAISEPDEPRDERDVDPTYAKLETKAKNYVRGVSELLEGSGIPLEVCEMCNDAYPGVRWATPSDDMHAALLAMVGAADSASPLLPDPDATLCERCNGFGWNKLPSHVPGNEQRMCRGCNGAGFLDPSPQSGTMVPPTTIAANGEVEPMVGVPENDPSVIDLRARGYTVVPPMRLPQEQT